ncbi:hypothetical protein EDD36DRAFT_326311 [Exophiala viscosa]|uniref:Secreted protein n=1 Tax=Exophiala viscosa TaxID=2486360 RepID=A0AAN6IAQ3_9EURO|nr:hypothetical protein EDD36DRAFT_326311 [Exophiala viscosa]
MVSKFPWLFFLSPACLIATGPFFNSSLLDIPKNHSLALFVPQSFLIVHCFLRPLPSYQLSTPIYYSSLDETTHTVLRAGRRNLCAAVEIK